MTLNLSLDELFAQAYEWQEKGQFYRAGQTYAEYLNHRGEDASAWNNLGNCYRSLGCDEKAVPCFDRALELEPMRCSSRLNRGLAQLSLGNYGAAWPDYEARLETISFKRAIVEQRDCQWQGERLGRNEVLYLFGNQGLGDALQVWRYLPEVAHRAAKIILELQEPLLSLTRDLPGNIEVIKRGDIVPRSTKWCELFSLPGIFGTTIGTVPRACGVGYARDVDILDQIAMWRQKRSTALHVGLVWSGTPANPINDHRAIGLEALRPLIELNHCQFYSLQKGAPALELERFNAPGRIVDLAPRLVDFASTATAVEALDLVITTDTSIPNLIGAMGREAWVLLHQPSDWRWGRVAEKSPWYPELELFRQPKMKDWNSVVIEVRDRIIERRSA